MNNSYGPLLSALPLSLADQTGGIDLNRDAAEQELRDQASTIDEHSEDAEDLKAKEAVRRASMESTSNEKGKASMVSSPVVPSAAPSDKLLPSSDELPSNEDEVEQEEDPHTANPPELKPVDEDVGPKEFYHPASVDPQRVVWIPQDELGLAEEERKAIADVGIAVSTEDARMDEKGHVDVSGAPPGGEVRVL